MNIEKEVRYRISRDQIRNIINNTESYKEKVEMLDMTFGYQGFNSLACYGFICRVRQKPGKTTVEVKKRVPEGWLEQEIKLGDISEGINYFNLVGMTCYMYLKREREVRKYGNLKIFIDEIEVVGDFVEIEYQDSKEGEKEIAEFLKFVGLEGTIEEDLYGDIIKEQLANNEVFAKQYKRGLDRILNKYLNKEKNMKFENFLIEKAKDDGIEKIVVGGVVKNNENKFLILGRKKDDFMGGIDEIPSGKLEKGETLFEGLIREVKEETGLDVEYIDNYIDYFDYTSGSGKKTRQYNFSVTTKNTDNVQLTEHDYFLWQDIEEVNNNEKITPKTKVTINISSYND